MHTEGRHNNHDDHQGGLLKSSDTLESIYRHKCAHLAQNPSKELCNRLALLEATHAKCFSVNGVVVDETFKVLLDVVAMATGITAVDMDDCGLANSHIEELVHYLYKLPHIKRISLEGNRKITNIGGQYLLDLAAHNKGLLALNLSRTSVKQSLIEEIESELDVNREHHNELETEGATSDGGNSEALGATYDHLHHVALRDPDQVDGDDVGFGENLFETLAHDSRVSSSLVRSLRIYDAVMSFSEELLSILCWESVVRSISALVGVMSCLYSDQLMSSTMLLMAMLMLRRRVPAADRKQEETPMVLNAPAFNQMLALVRQTRWKLSSNNKDKVCDGMEDVTMMMESGLMLLQDKACRRKISILTVLLLVATLFTSLANILAFLALVAFGHSPLLFHAFKHVTSQSASFRVVVAKWLAPDSIVADPQQQVSSAPTLTRSVSRVGGKLRGSPSFARLPRAMPDSSVESPREKGPFDERFEFSCIVERLIDASVQHFSGRQFVPMVHVRYHRHSWLSTKAHRPWHWNEQSSLFTFVPGATKLSFYLYDEASDVVGAVCEGHLILDDAVSFERPMVVKLYPSSTAPSLLKTLVEDLNAHERADKHRLGLISADHAGTSAFKLERAGSLVVRICPHMDDSEEDHTLAAQPPEIVLTSATPHFRGTPGTVHSPPSLDMSSSSPPPQVANTVAKESIVRDRSSTNASSVGGGTASLHFTPASTPRELGGSTTSSMIYKSGGSGSVQRQQRQL